MLATFAASLASWMSMDVIVGQGKTVKIVKVGKMGKIGKIGKVGKMGLHIFGKAFWGLAWTDSIR